MSMPPTCLRFRVSLVLLTLCLPAGFIAAQERPIVLRASTLLDGKGKTLHNTVVVVQGGKIVSVGEAAPKGAITYDLSRLTVLPGWIDAHVHPTWHFDATGKLAGESEPDRKSVV